jgi:hypothetical protein
MNANHWEKSNESITMETFHHHVLVGTLVLVLSTNTSWFDG